jgi:polar amino acid transport system permease protein
MLAGYGPQLLRGAATTLEVALTAAALGLTLGLAGGTASLSRHRWLRRTVQLTTGILRGVPEFVILLVCFFGLTGFLFRLTNGHVQISPFVAGAVALGLTFAAFASEAFRGAFAAVPSGQHEAAAALGLSPATTFRRILLPQALRLAIPSLANQWQTLLKDTSLVSVIGLGDLMRSADTAGQATNRPFDFLLAAAAIYFVFLTLSQPVFTAIERRARRGLTIPNARR